MGGIVNIPKKDNRKQTKHYSNSSVHNYYHQRSSYASNNHGTSGIKESIIVDQSSSSSDDEDDDEDEDDSLGCNSDESSRSQSNQIQRQFINNQSSRRSSLFISSSSSLDTSTRFQTSMHIKMKASKQIASRSIEIEKNQSITKIPNLGSPSTPIWSPASNLQRISQLTVDISSDSSSQTSSLERDNNHSSRIHNNLKDKSAQNSNTEYSEIGGHVRENINSSILSLDSRFSSSESGLCSSESDFSTSISDNDVYDWLNSTMAAHPEISEIKKKDNNDIGLCVGIREPNMSSVGGHRHVSNITKLIIPLRQPQIESSSRSSPGCRKIALIQSNKFGRVGPSNEDVHKVKNTNVVSRKKANLPLDKPDARSGNWLTNRYIVNQYIILHEIGQGSYAQVRLCKERISDSLYAMKIMNKSLLRKKSSGNACVMEGIKREIAIMKKLRHKHVLRLNEVINDPSCNKLYLVLEYMKGGDLYRSEPMSNIDVWHVTRQMLLGLSYLHQNSIIHGDIKPQNLLLNENGEVKIADFGISKILEGNEKQLDTAGTPAFMCPELLAGEPYDGKLADIWSMGATLFCLRCGHPPFQCTERNPARQMLSLYQQILHEPVVFTQSDVSEGLKGLINAMMHKEDVRRITLEQAINHYWFATRPFSGANEFVQSCSPTKLIVDASTCKKVKVTCKDIFMSVQDVNGSPNEMMGQEEDKKVKSFQMSRELQFSGDQASLSSSSSNDESECIICSQAEVIMKTLDFQLSCIDPRTYLAEDATISTNLFGGILDCSNQLRIVYSSSKGKRPTQEDVVFTRMNHEVRCTMISIYDGHCGTTCATQLQNYFSREFEKESFHFSKYTEADLKNTFSHVDDDVCDFLRKINNKSGSTALVALFYSDDDLMLTLSNVGDSSTVLVSSGKAILLNNLHRLNTTSERERVLRGGGIIRNERVNGVLAVTRSFGDVHHKDDDEKCSITSVPDVICRKIEVLDEYLILGSDGLFDYLSPNEAARIVARKVTETNGDCHKVCEFLINEAIRHGSQDNISAAIVFFHQNSTHSNG